MKTDSIIPPSDSGDHQPLGSPVNLFINDYRNRVPERATTWINYYRLALEWNGEIKDRQPVLEPVLHQGKARLVNAAPGATVQGTLVDCPESEGNIGCVVVDTGSEILAVQSAALSCLVIEHALCCLEFVAVPVRGVSGQIRWDWDAYELSPYGSRILVSDPH